MSQPHRELKLIFQLTNLLDISSQADSRVISMRILNLTQDGADDNATVKVITVFTLVYLPASFMAVRTLLV